MADAETIRSERRARLRMAPDTDISSRLEVMRQIINEISVLPSLKKNLYEAVNAVFRSEAQLNRVIADKSAGSQLIETHLQKYRDACKAVIVLDYEFAYDAYIEEQLRVVHTTLRATYRNRLHKLRQQKDKQVEMRRTHGEYLKFIKASQIFYRKLVLDLDRIHGEIPGLRKAAQTWKDINGNEEAAPMSIPSGEAKQHLLLAVQRTLLILGDLSRWRASDLDGQKPNRGPALGYYHLANDIYPPSGIAWNQLALIELESENVNYLQALFYLYRGLCATEVRSGPRSNLDKNLKSVFEKVAKMMERKQLFPQMMRVNNGVAGALMSWFLWLQTMCFKGEDCLKFKELEKEVMSQVSNEVKKGPKNIEILLQKIVLISLGGGHYTTNKLKENQDDKVMQSFFYYLRFNARMLQTLLELLNSELEFVGDRQDVKNQGSSSEHVLADKVGGIMRRAMPALRFYSVWFRSYWRILGADIPGSKITAFEVQDLWRTYVHSLNLLASTFPLEKLPLDDYLLPEDDETLGFGALFDDEGHRNWYNSTGLKPKYSDSGVARNLPNIETLMRVRGFLLDGEDLCKEEAPVTLSLVQNSSKNGGVIKLFAYTEQEEAQAEVANQQSPEQEYAQVDGVNGSSGHEYQHADQAFIAHNQIPDGHTISAPVAPEATSLAASKDQALSRMVDNLLDDDELTNGRYEAEERLPPTTPHQQTFSLTASPVVNPYAGSPGMDGYQPYHPGQGDFVLFSSSTSPRPVGSAPSRNREVHEVAEMSRRLSSIGRSGSGASPLTRPLPTFPSLPDESARIWGLAYPPSTQAPSAGPVLPHAPASALQSPLAYGNNYGYRGSLGSVGASPWSQHPSPTSESFRRVSVPPNQMHENMYTSPPATNRSSQEYAYQNSSPYGGAPSSNNTPSGLGSAALGGSALPTALGMGSLPNPNRRVQWPAS